MGFTASKGSPQALQRCSDLHAVALNWAVTRVSVEPQRGQPGDSGRRPRVSGMGPVRCGAGEGGAMPTAAPLAPVSGRTGRDGIHTEAMGYILAELQSVARAHPDATW